MKRFLSALSPLLLAPLLLVLGITLPAQAQALLTTANTPQRSLTVTGEAEIRVVPDQVLISMTAETRGANLLTTREKNEQTVKSVVDYATGSLGIAPEYIQTDFTSIEPVYRNCDYRDELSGRCNPLEIVYYSVQKGIQIRLNDLSKYEGLITEALQSGITNIDNVQFITTELRQHRDKARELAAQAAHEKAEAVAKTLGVRVGKPITINTENYSAFYWHGHGGRRSGQNRMTQNVVQQTPSPTAGQADGLALGQINISATIRVTYEIE